MAIIKEAYEVKGMHCASCVRVIEKALTKTPGVAEANVNLATEKATVVYDGDKTSPEDLSSAVSGVGYKLITKENEQGDDVQQREKREELKRLRNKVILSLGLGALVVWGSFPGLMDTAPIIIRSFWTQLVLGAIVQFGPGLDFYRATLPALRHRTANMDTLVAIGTTVAFTYSAFVTFFPRIIESAGIKAEPYFDVATIIVGLILLGRYFEARAKM